MCTDKKLFCLFLMEGIGGGLGVGEERITGAATWTKFHRRTSHQIHRT